MPLGILSDSDLEKEIENLGRKKPEEPRGQIIDLNIGRGKGNVGVPEVIQKVIGETAIRSGNKAAKQISSALDISDSSVSAYKNGATSTASYDKPSTGIQEYLDKTKKEISAESRIRLLQALEEITPDKLSVAKVRDISGVAKDMSVIIKNMETEEGEKETRQPLIIYAPTLRDERSFEVIQTKE